MTGTRASVLGCAILLALCGALALEPRLRELGVPGLIERYEGFRVVSALFFGLPGLVVLTGRPGHRIGWIMFAVGCVQAFSLALGSYGLLGVYQGGLPGADEAMWWSTWMWAPPYLAVPTLFLLLFPDGRPPSPRWRPVAWLSVLAMAASGAGWALTPVEKTDVPGLYPEGYHGVSLPGGALAAPLQAAGLVMGALAAGCSIAALVVRYRASAGQVRRQIQWVLAAGLVMVAMLGIALVGTAPLLLTLAPVPLALAVTLAIVFHRLWEIDAVLARVLALTTVAVGGLAVYVLVMSGLRRTFGDGAAFVAVAVVAFGAQPAYAWIRTRVNKMVFGDRDDPASVLRGLGVRLSGTGAPDALLVQLAESLGRALRLRYVAVEEGGAVVAAWGASEGGASRIGLLHRGEPVGTLLVEGTLRKRDHTGLHGLAPHVAVAVHAHRLSADLERSHGRLLAAREEERARLMRELHDGVGPTLAALALQADQSRMLISEEPSEADRLLAELATRIRATVEDVRAIVHELRPPPLDELGLPGALTELGRRFTGGLEVDVTAGELPVLPADVELAAYRIAAEALANAARHARASRCEISLRAGAALELSIADDGVGLPPSLRRGVGLDSMRRRALDLGGTFDLTSGPGTRILVRLPLEPAS